MAVTGSNDVSNQQNQTGQSGTGGMDNSQSQSGAPGGVNIGQQSGNSGGQGTQSSSGSTPQGSGRFTNLQQYIGANQGAGQQMANNISSKFNTATNGQLDKASTSAQAVQQGIKSAQGNIDQGNQWQQQISAGTFDPTTVANGNADAFNAARTGTSYDPSALMNGVQTAQNQAAQAQTSAQNYQSLLKNGGLSGVLQNTYQNQYNPYSQGQQSLDSLMIQGSGGNLLGNLQSGAQQANQKASQALNQYNNLQTGDLANLGNASNTLATGLQTGIEGLDTSFGTDLTNRATTTNANNAAAYGQLSGDIASGKLTKDDLAQLGVDPSQNTYGFDIKQLIGATNPIISANTNLGLNDIATTQDAAKQQALAKLSGLTDYTNLGGQQLAPTGKSVNGLNIDKNALTNALTGAKNTYQTNLNSANDAVDNAKQGLNGFLSNYFSDPSVEYNNLSQLTNNFSNNVPGGYSVTPEEQSAINAIQNAQTAQSSASSVGTQTWQDLVNAGMNPQTGGKMNMPART